MGLIRKQFVILYLLLLSLLPSFEELFYLGIYLFLSHCSDTVYVLSSQQHMATWKPLEGCKLTLVEPSWGEAPSAPS